MNADCVGKAVSLDCGALGFYQGTIKSISISDSSITLDQPYQNGKACDVPTVTIR